MSYLAAAPLIVTLKLDDAAQTYFNALRRQHFPPAINYLGAHLTLFHHLPGAEVDAVCEELRTCTLAQGELPLRDALPGAQQRRQVRGPQLAEPLEVRHPRPLADGDEA